MNKQPSLPDSFDETLAAFLRSLLAENRSEATILAYKTDISQFTQWLAENTLVSAPTGVTRVDIAEFMTALGQAAVSGQSRARKLAALRSYFGFLVTAGLLASSPAASVPTPKREKRGRSYLSQEGYTQLLALAGGIPRDYAIIQLFLQTGIRVSELVGLTLDDVDLALGVLHVRGKGLKDRDIPLAKKAIAALKIWLTVRPDTPHRTLFLNRYDGPITVRGVQKLVDRYRRGAGMTKHITPHSLRHTFATEKYNRGVSPFQLRDYLGHASVATTQVYVHLAQKDAKKVMEATSL